MERHFRQCCVTLTAKCGGELQNCFILLLLLCNLVLDSSFLQTEVKSSFRLIQKINKYEYHCRYEWQHRSYVKFQISKVRWSHMVYDGFFVWKQFYSNASSGIIIIQLQDQKSESSSYFGLNCFQFSLISLMLVLTKMWTVTIRVSCKNVNEGNMWELDSFVLFTFSFQILR